MSNNFIKVLLCVENELRTENQKPVFFLEPEQIKTKNVSIEERIKNLENKYIIIEKSLLGIIERL